MIEVSGTQFETVAALQEHLQALLKQPSTLDDSKTQALVVACVARYAKIQDILAKDGATIVRVFAAVNTKYKHMSTHDNPNHCFHVVVSGLSQPVTVSAAKVAQSARSTDAAHCVQHRRPLDGKLAELRESVWSHVREFKKRKQDEQEWKCCGCGVPLQQLPAAFQHADHTGPYEFRHLVSEYARIHHDGDVMKIPAERFVTFHNMHGSLQMLCITCNVTKKRKSSDAWVRDNPLP
tara:strand:- start:178 stop:885 length:708 start_codon:yes stop_codon:yes gene_type:complete